MRRALLILTLAAGWSARPAAGQLRLTVADAMSRARADHPQLNGVRADRRGAEADARGSLAAYLPRVNTEWMVMRTDDPVAVFGSKLRQGIFAGPDLALDALNQPAAVSNASLSLTVEQPLIAPEGWFGRRAALAGVEAGRLAESRAAQMTAFDGLRTYFAAVLADARIAVLDTALVAARRTLEQVQALRREGVVTAVDEQLALARVSELEAGRLMADAERVAAQDQLLLAIGEMPGQTVDLVDGLTVDSVAAAEGERLDLAARRKALDALDANLKRVSSQRLPNVGAFGTLNYNDANLGTLGGPRHWTAGVVVRWSPFRGLQDVAAADRARAERERGRADL
ncbi:MAG: TolC family protein, partial [Gemmatimonadales bacterium]